MIDELGRHGYRLSAGTLYPILHGMERQGYLRSRLTLNGGRNRRVYRATPAGRKALVIARQRVQELFGEMFSTTDGRRRGSPMIQSYAWILAVVVMLSPAVGVSAQAPQAQPQTPPPNLFTLDQALQYAVDHYPTVRTAPEQINTSTAGVSVAKSAYLPRLDSVWQSNRGTANNIFGQVLPQCIRRSEAGR
jgi:hypothetical protein